MMHISVSGLGGWIDKGLYEEENTCCPYCLPAEPWGPVGSPGCWRLWSSRHCCRSQRLQSWSEDEKRNWEVTNELGPVWFTLWMWRRLHVRGDEVVLVDANLQVTLHGRFIYGNIPLDRSLRESQYNLELIFYELPLLRCQSAESSSLPSKIRIIYFFQHTLTDTLTCTNCRSCLRQRTVTLGSRSW